MTEVLPTWQLLEPRRTAFFHDAAAWTLIGVLAGTGGNVSRDHILMHYGTGAPAPARFGSMVLSPDQGLAFELKLIRQTLRLSVAETAQLFGVSRPTIYSWQNGNPISPENAERLREIAQALEPHLGAIDAQVGRVAHRAIENQNTLLQRLAQGANAREAIARLADILRLEAAQRQRLASRLQGRSGDRGASDLDSLG